MYCPTCGSEERQISQYCRACGTDLRAVPRGLEMPDLITASAVSAREQISQALADRIRQMETARDLERVAEDVLPQLETLRRRAGPKGARVENAKRASG